MVSRGVHIIGNEAKVRRKQNEGKHHIPEAEYPEILIRQQGLAGKFWLQEYHDQGQAADGEVGIQRQDIIGQG